MSPDQMNAIDRFLAEKVMGWQVDWPRDPDAPFPDYNDDFALPPIWVESGIQLRRWHPTRNADQAMMVFAQCPGAHLYHNVDTGLYEAYCDIDFRTTETASFSMEATPMLALCLSVARKNGYEEGSL